LEAQFSL